LTSVEVTNLVAGYGNKTLIRNLSFFIKHPAFVAVIGHNGCGKTTLFKAFTHQIPYQGNIFLSQQLLLSTYNPSVSGMVALLAQKNIVGFSMSVKELIVMGRFRLKRFFEPYNAADFDKVYEVLKLLRMEHLADKDFLELSGGEQQLVWLAQLIMQDATLCLLDEPTQQLDVYNKRRVFELMMYWVKHFRKMVFCITHDLYYLHQTEGFLLNLSMPDPTLEPINKEAIQRNIAWLESKALHASTY
jgi:iron complex transport system ATP-binding protein